MEHETNRERAVAYVRVSTDQQDYSIKNQMEAIEEYAEKNHLKITEIFKDEGKSGVQLKGRAAMVSLLELVRSGKADFKHLLIYDVSRFGRFQNADEAAFHEYEFNRAGIYVHYCAEDFINDGTAISSWFKMGKRMEAGSYSRNLSEKVFRGQCNLARMGFRQGGTIGYGLRRMRVNAQGEHLGILEKGQYKAIQTDRVVQVLGPEEEVKIVRWIYDSFIKKGKSEKEIAGLLNRKGIKTDLGREWCAASVLQILTNEKYIGNNVFNKTSGRLSNLRSFEKRRVVKTDREQWVRAENVFPAIIDASSFRIVQNIINERTRKYSNEELLDKLKKLLSCRGKVSGILIDEEEWMPSSAVYSHRFGGLLRAYELIGYSPQKDYSYIQINKYLRNLHAGILEKMETGFEKYGAFVEKNIVDDGTRWINREIKIMLNVSRCRRMESGRSRWLIRLERLDDVDFFIIARMNADNKTVKDYYLISRFDRESIDSKINEENSFFMEAFRHDNMDWFYQIFSRTHISTLIK